MSELTDDLIVAQFTPREDITAYELALCLPYIEGVGGWKVRLIPAHVRRHFRCVYDSRFRPASELAQTFTTQTSINPEEQNTSE